MEEIKVRNYPGNPNFIRLGLDCEKGVERNNNTGNGVIVVFGSRKEKEGL